MNWFERIFARLESEKPEQPPAGSASPTPTAAKATSPNPFAQATNPVLTPPPDFGSPSSLAQAEEYLARVQEKSNKLAEEFASGLVNRAQFVSLFEHYQKERQTIEHILEIDPESWRQAASEGKSLVIRQTHYARPLGFSIYENATGLPITTLGKFDLDPALMVPMLSSYREATREIFGSRVRSTQIESGRWMCFVGGAYTTLIALFSTEPANRQLKSLEETHLFFEKANQPALSMSPISIEGMIFPHEYYLR